MWVPFHHKARTRIVTGGNSFLEVCPECGLTCRFDEVEISESIGAFFLDLFDHNERKYRCSGCQELFDLRDDAQPQPARAQPPARSASDTAARRARAEATEAEQRRAHAEARAIRIEDELAELKKRMGR